MHRRPPVKNKILAILKERPGYRSGHEISDRVGISRSAVWKHMQQLRRDGHQIEAKTRQGYCLVYEADMLTRQTLLDALADSGLAEWLQVVDFADETDSTNEMAKRAAAAQAPDRSLFIARYQTAGRGRRGHAWVAQADLGLTFSLLLRPDADARDIASATLFAGLCAAQGLNHAIKQAGQGAAAGIKWPNDLIAKASGKKLGGILTETAMEENRVAYLVIGIGLNLNQTRFDEDLAASATSLRLECNRLFRRLDVLAAVLQRFRALETYLADRPAWMGAYRDLLLTLGKPVRILEAGRPPWIGQAVDLDEEGELVVRDVQGQRQTVRSGAVSVRGLMGYHPPAEDIVNQKTK